ncbi:hypothetical protein BMT54_03880 [Pasteurellaceae bacterium 15-036681]|nr:hypothetical protein BMT54_03880 [Pasteurellaceae bacterium 15-036681]
MKKPLSSAILALILTACTHTQTSSINENSKDLHGCTSANQSYSFLKQTCVKLFEIADIKLTDPTNHTLSAYVLLSEDKQQAEIFALDIPENTILDVVKGGYLSKDNKIRLIKTANSWKIIK